MKSIGCTVEGVLRSNMPKREGGRRDSIVLSILKPEWENGIKEMLRKKTKGIIIDNSSLVNGFLPKPSVVVYEKPGVISPNLLIKKIGLLHQNTFRQIVLELVQFLQS